MNYVLGLRGETNEDQLIQLFVVDCYELNVASVNHRYQQNDHPQPIRFTRSGSIPKWSNEQLFKYLECLSYQCAEGDCEQSETYQKLERLIGHIARAIVSESKQYELARWDYAA